MDISIRELNLDQLRDALPLVLRVFSHYEGVNYREEGKKAFFNAIHDEKYLKELCSYGAFLQDILIGIIATRNNLSHIALFFVDGEYQNKISSRSGIQSGLFSIKTGNVIIRKL
ncbi:MAG: GNAT family N-acetyltransferase [Candidatus Ornithospirochaeta sp.]